MAKVFFSMSGDGRGHATRVRAVVEQLRGQHAISLFAPDDAYRFLTPLYAGTEVRVRRIPGLRFSYTTKRRLDFIRTAREAGTYLKRLPLWLRMLERLMRREEPDLLITDFELALPRAARRCGVPFISLDHQHFLLAYDLNGLPLRLRWHAWYMGWIVRAYFQGQIETMVSSFYFPPLKPGCHNVTQVGVLLRPEITAASPTSGSHLLLYCRRFAGDHVLAALAAVGREVRIYGLGARADQGSLRFRQIDESRFIEDLASCQALLSTAGNQIVGEALYLQKPALVMPEARNFEQQINATFLRDSGAGDWVEMEKLTVAHVTRFLARLDEFQSRIKPERLNGLPKVMTVLRRHLPEPEAARTLAQEISMKALTCTLK